MVVAHYRAMVLGREEKEAGHSLASRCTFDSRGDALDD